MRIEIKKLISFVTVVIVMSGCKGPHLGDANGWSDDQQTEFEQILKKDKYASLCNLRPLYQEYLQKKDTAILTKILVGYSRNLAKSCIDIDTFKAQMRKRKDNKIHSHFDIVQRSYSATDVVSMLNDGYTIAEIMQKYAPKNPLFKKFAKLNSQHINGKGLNPANYRKLKLSVERTKLLSDEGWGKRYALVNIPEFEFRLIENNTTTMKFPVVVGKKKWQTPVFSSTMTYIVLNPTWNVPDNIAKAEEIPKIIKNPNYLKKKNMLVYKSYDVDSKPVNPSSVPWKSLLSEKYKKRGLPYKIIEQPSKRNALGVVKFMFPNKFSVYMHDTPSKSYFKRSVRAYSHGCVRLSNPLGLLKHLSDNNITEDMNSINKKFESKKMQYMTLKEKIPVHIVYLTAYPEENGQLKFFQDIYGFDKIQHLIGESE